MELHLRERKTENLLRLIEGKRTKMFSLCEVYGINSKEVLDCSRKLDSLILEYQGINNYYKNINYFISSQKK